MADANPDLVIVGREDLTPIPPRPTPRVHIRSQVQRGRRSAIFSRTRDIVAANVTDLLDKAEDPAKMIRLMIVEMEETLIDVRASTARTIADQKEMRRQLARLETLQASWAEKAELALSKDREDLAKAALIEKQKAADMADHLQGEIALLDNAMKASEIDIARVEAKLREARARQSAIVARLQSAHHRARMREMTAGARVDEAFARFELLERRVDMAEGHADALALGAPAKTLEEELAELRTAEMVETELEAMKAARKDAA
ncbi:phage shock protein PspA [Sphingosinicella humi]|uniref:Phage shock protein PspA n=1 Tax=Allosphingosinicella humi TaxID=2068657 RepID=A0A2U2J011_9SPHN|nr:phage shock protein PspA [Sphingosinicella humi]PWG01621.1 phage shock protein PspA [Sphingosinicella humi]